MGIKSFLHYSFRDSLRSIKRHKAMAFASVATVAVSLFIMGITLLLVINSEFMLNSMESQLEINVFLKQDVSEEDAQNLKDKIKKVSGFKSLEYIPKEEALDIMQKRFGQDTNLFEAMGGTNPLPDSYKVKALSTADVDFLASEIEQFFEVEKVRYGKELVDKLISFTEWMRNTGLGVIVGMLLAALFLITTTIRLTVFARKKEITIMQYVGATKGFIRFPFFLEGLIIGFFGSLIAGVILYFGYVELIKYVAQSVSFLPLISDLRIVLRLVLILLVGGTILGAGGSVIALRKYLKV